MRLGVAATAIAARGHTLFVERVRRGDPCEPPRFPLAFGVAGALAVLGAGMAVYLLVTSL